MIHRRVTIRDIAKETGMHFTTVSMALRNSPRLKAETREKIQALAREMGYIPDPMLAALNAYRQTKAQPHYQATIAWINNWPDRHHMLSIPEFREYYDGATERAKERGYILEEFWLKERGMTPKIASQIFRARNIQGVLIAPQPQTQELLPFAYDEISAVAMGYSMQPAVLHLITNHHYHTMDMMLTRLHELGYRRIGMGIDDTWDKKVENAWQGGGLLWNWRHGNQLSLHKCPEPLAGEELVKWLRQEKLEAIIATEHFLQKLGSAKLNFPEDMGYLNIALKRNETHSSGVYQNDWMIGMRAIDLIIDMIHRGERGIPSVPVRTLVESTWYPGETLRQQVVGIPVKAMAKA